MHPRPLVKVCGLTRPEDVILAVELGAWAVGFVFAPSPRQVTVEVARGLATAAREAARTSRSPGGLPRGPLTVGVFGDCSPEAIAEVVHAVGLDAVQLHGSRPDALALRDDPRRRGSRRSSLSRRSRSRPAHAKRGGRA